MKKNYILGVILGASILGTAQMGGMHTDQLTFSAKLDGSQANVTTSALGVGAFTLNATMDTICYTVSVNGMSGSITAAHLHTGTIGNNGAVAIPLTGIDNNKITGIITGTTLTDNLPTFITGGLYVNLHTSANPAGEIRGQVYLEQSTLFKTSLSEDGTGTSGIGLGSFSLSQDKSTINYMVVADDLTGMITGAHLHFGAPNVSGGVAINLITDLISGTSVLKGSFDASSTVGFIDSLMTGSIYIALHTTANPAGELRGQLMKSNTIAYDAMLDTDQQTQTISGNGMGLSILELNPTLDTLFYKTLATGLSGAITAAHIHNATFGMDGGVAFNLTPSISGNEINGMVTGTDLTNDLITKMLRGETYINLHTATNAAGEIRGQVYKFARDGYRIYMSGDQQVPALSIAAQGSGYISVARDASDARIMVVISDLTGPATAGHLHKAIAGENGGVAFNLSSMLSMTTTDEAVMGYWKSDNATTPFTVMNANTIYEDSIYINIHTSINAGGEFRGQVIKTPTCLQYTPNAIDELTNNTVNVFPNPTASLINLNTSKTISSIEIYSLDGRIVNAINQLNTSSLEVDLSALDTGIYLVSITFENQTKETVRIVKK